VHLQVCYVGAQRVTHIDDGQSEMLGSVVSALILQVCGCLVINSGYSCGVI